MLLDFNFPTRGITHSLRSAKSETIPHRFLTGVFVIWGTYGNLKGYHSSVALQKADAYSLISSNSLPFHFPQIRNKQMHQCKQNAYSTIHLNYIPWLHVLLALLLMYVWIEIILQMLTTECSAFGPLTTRRTLRWWGRIREGQQSWWRVWNTSLMKSSWGSRGD